MMHKFCMECRLSFGLVEQSEIASTCVDCLSKMRGPFLECSDCGRVILKFEFRYEKWQRVCSSCMSDVISERFYDLDQDDPDDLIEWSVLSQLDNTLRNINHTRQSHEKAMKALGAWEKLQRDNYVKRLEASKP